MGLLLYQGRNSHHTGKDLTQNYLVSVRRGCMCGQGGGELAGRTLTENGVLVERVCGKRVILMSFSHYVHNHKKNVI